MPARQLGEADARVGRRGRKAHRGQHVVRPERRLEQALEEIARLDACACPSARRYRSRRRAPPGTPAVRPPDPHRRASRRWCRDCGSPDARCAASRSAISGACFAMSEERSSVTWRVSAPISTMPFLTEMPSSPATPLISTSSDGLRQPHVQAWRSGSARRRAASPRPCARRAGGSRRRASAPSHRRMLPVSTPSSPARIAVRLS